MRIKPSHRDHRYRLEIAMAAFTLRWLIGGKTSVEIIEMPVP